MPERAARICPRCQQAYTGRQCECQREARQRYDWDRGKDRQFYGTKRWRKVRRLVLQRDKWCVLCAEDGKPYVIATVADHIIPREGRPDLAYSVDNCRGLCVSCHNRRTRLQEQGVSA